VPLVLRLPGGAGAGTRLRGPVPQVDVPATLLDLAGRVNAELDHDARVDAIRFATALLGAEHVPEVARFADHGWAGPHVCGWLARQGTPAAREALVSRQGDLEAFTQRCAQALRGAGFVVLRMQSDGLFLLRRRWRVLGERHWFDAGKFLDRRAEPGLMAEIVGRVRSWGG